MNVTTTTSTTTTSTTTTTTTTTCRSVADVIVDAETMMDADVFFAGAWQMRSNGNSSGEQAVLGDVYWVSDAADANLLFLPPLSVSGLYNVFVTYASLNGSATNAPVRVLGDGPRVTTTVDQTQPLAAGEFLQVPGGPFPFDAEELQSVVVGTESANGLVSADAVKLVFADC